jgi:pilus assembly protein Flp/PilA
LGNGATVSWAHSGSSNAHRKIVPEQEQTMLKVLKSFVANESGATAIEYALIASLIAVFIIAALNNLGNKLSSEFSEIANDLK